LRGTEAIAAAGAFVDVAAEKVERLHAIHPFAQRGTACMFSGGKFVEARALRRKVDDEIERLQIVERCERFCDFLFRVFPRRVKGRDVAVAEAGPLSGAKFGFQRADLAMKIEEAETLAKRARVVVAFVISRQDPNFFAKRFHDFATAVEVLAKRGEIAGSDVDICWLRDQLFEGARIAVDVAEDQNLHGATA